MNTDSNISSKKAIHDILDIGIPSFLETLFTTFASIIDSKMVSAMGVAAISAVSVTNQPRLFIFSIFFALNTVTSSLVARYVGKEDRDAANMVLDHVLKLVIVLSLIAGALAAAAARPIMIAFSNQKDTLDASIIYFQIVMGGMVFNIFYMAVNSALRGCGLTKLTFASNVLSCTVNIFFNYLLIEGHWGFPRLEYAGAAIATVLGTVAASILSLLFILRKDMFINIPYCLRHRFKMTRESLSEIVELSKSSITDNLAMRFSLLFSAGIVARIGSYQMAVYSIGMHLLNVNMALGYGFQSAGVALTGRCYGASDRNGMQTYKKYMVRMGIISAAVLSAVIILGGKWFYGFFSQDTAFVTMGAISCIFIGVITISQTMKFIYQGCLQGVGAMKEVMAASITAFAGVNLSALIILILVFDAGIWGVWIATFLLQTVQAVMLCIFLRRWERDDQSGKIE